MTHFVLAQSLPEAAEPAVEIVRALVAAGHEALLAGGCVRDLLLGTPPHDWDVATDAPPERVCALFRPTRKVGAQFGVVLVRRRQRWIEVATFRSDLGYVDGRRPVGVAYSDAEHDALRRDFTINGMFLDPVRGEVRDFVGGQADLEARLVRAIGVPAQRFDEDYLRLLRAVRFAARLEFALEAETQGAVRAHAPTLSQVAAERVREELSKMLAHPNRALAWRLLAECALLPHLWPGAQWTAALIERVGELLGRLPGDAPFTTALAVLLHTQDRAGIERSARALTLSNEERERVLWLVAHQADLDAPAAPALAALKRLLAAPGFAELRMLAGARHVDLPDGAARGAALDARIAKIRPEAVAPPPLVTGDDLLARRVPAGPRYAELLETLYTRQLAEELTTRAAALAALDQLLATPPGRTPDGSLR
jgi:poly(A) polymerase